MIVLSNKNWCRFKVDSTFRSYFYMKASLLLVPKNFAGIKLELQVFVTECSGRTRRQGNCKCSRSWKGDFSGISRDNTGCNELVKFLLMLLWEFIGINVGETFQSLRAAELARILLGGIIASNHQAQISKDIQKNSRCFKVGHKALAYFGCQSTKNICNFNGYEPFKACTGCSCTAENTVSFVAP